MGERLQRLRLARQLSQSQLARAAQVPVRSLQSWEQGKRIPAFDTAARLARALGVSLDELAGDEPPAGEKGKGKKGK
jgi:transcriptional regulator with XRE-family HTH domain